VKGVPHQETEFLVDGNQAFVECLVVEIRQAQAVSWIKALFPVRLPRDNVAGDKQIGNSQAGHTTGVPIR